MVYFAHNKHFYQSLKLLNHPIVDCYELIQNLLNAFQFD